MPVTEKQMANLIPQNKRSQRERKEIARMGAEATNRVKAEKKTLRQCAELFGAMPDIKTAEELKSQGIDADGVTQNMGVIFGLYKSAKRGNSNSARVLAELVGELKQQQTNVTVTTNVNPFANLTEDELRKLAKED
jgi:hypothetical protein